MALKGIRPEDVKPSKPNILVSGPPKTHKSRFSLEFPRNYYIDTEGANNKRHYMATLKEGGGVYFGPAQGSQNFELILDEVKMLMCAEHEYRVLTIDSVSELEGIYHAKEQERMDNAGSKDMYGAFKKPAIRLMRRLYFLTKQLDMTVLWIAHAKDKWAGEGDTRKVVGTTFDAWEKLGYKFDFWGESRLVGKEAIMTVRGSRYLSFPIGNEIPMHYAAFAKTYGQEIMEKPAQPVVFAVPEQLTEINRILGILKMDAEEFDKWMSKAQAEELSDLSTEKATELLDLLNKKLKGEIK